MSKSKDKSCDKMERTGEKVRKKMGLEEELEESKQGQSSNNNNQLLSPDYEGRQKESG